MKVVISKDISFGLSRKGVEYLAALGHEKAKEELKWFDNYQGLKDDALEHAYCITLDDKERTDLRLVKTVEDLGKEVNYRYSDLKIVEIPDDVEFYIHSVDGSSEEIHEKHRVWS